MIEERKDWLTAWMEEGRRRKDLGLPETYLYEKETTAVTYSDFINKELVLFSNSDNERSIPSMVDGFKPGQRKVMFTCIKRNDKKEIKVAQLAGSVGEKSAYHHGEASLVGTIINLAQDYVGSNNINLLQPKGQFGTRLQGGKDHASGRYIFTKMSPLARLIFNPKDDPLLKYLTDDNQRVEPEWYIPIIPMSLVNGADGIGTGWMTKVPNYNPRDLVKIIFDMLNGKTIEEIKNLVPWYKGFRGTIEPLDYQRYVCNGEIAELSETKILITELPIKTWTNNYKENVLEPYLNGSEKVKAMINDYRDSGTDTLIHYEVSMPQEEKRKAETGAGGIHSFFKLQTTLTTTSMVMFDKSGCIRRYDNVMEIMQDFFVLRLEYYGKRKKYLEAMLGAEALKLSNQARFIIEKCDFTLKVENKKRKKMIEELVTRNYDPDPVKKFKAQNDISNEDSQEVSEEAQEGQETQNDSQDDDTKEEEAKADDYDYLLAMPMWNLTQEKKEELLRKKQEKHQELNNLKATSKEDLWRADLTEFLQKLDEVEQKQLEDQQCQPKGKKGAKKGTKKPVPMSEEKGIRIEPKISDDMKRKASAAVEEKKRKESKTTLKKEPKVKKLKDEPDEFDDMADDKEHNKSLSDRLGLDTKQSLKSNTNTKKTKKDTAKITEFFKKEENESSDGWSDTETQTTESTQPETKPVRSKKLNKIDSDDSDFGDTASKASMSKKSNGSADKPPAAKKPKISAPKAPKKSKNVFVSSDEASGSDVDFGGEATSEPVVARELPGRSRKAVANYNFYDESSSGSDFE